MPCNYLNEDREFKLGDEKPKNYTSIYIQNNLKD